MKKALAILFLMFAAGVSLIGADDIPQKKEAPVVKVGIENKEQLFTPSSSVLYAHNDLKNIPEGTQQHVRYLSLYNIPSAQRKAMGQTVAFLINSLSRRKTMFLPPFLPGTDDTVLRINLNDYDIPAKAWEDLGKDGSGIKPFADPYFHTFVDKVFTKTVKGKKQEITKRVFVFAPWVDREAITYLAEYSQSASPILRADWFIANASAPPAYYNFLALGDKQSDFEKLVFASEVRASKAKSQVKGIAVTSIVARNNRTLTRSPTFTGGYYWISHDTLNSNGDRDYTRTVIDEEFDAVEIIATLPNGLQTYFLANATGVRQDAAPTDIAIDHNSADKTVRTGRSCIICHNTGIHPIDCEIRRLTQQLTAFDKVKFLPLDEKDHYKIVDLFGSNIDKIVKRDQELYAEAIFAVSGLKTEQNALQFADFYDSYAERLMKLEDVAREICVPIEQLESFIAKSDDPHVLGLTKKPIRPLRRDQWERSFGGLMLLVYTGQ